MRRSFSGGEFAPHASVSNQSSNRCLIATSASKNSIVCSSALLLGAYLWTNSTRRLLLDGADAEDQLYKSNLRLVVSIARRTYWTHQKLDPLDIIQAGNLGLVRAVQLFDHRLGYKFSTYATWWIRQAIDRHVADAGRTIRLPVHLLDSIRALRSARRALELELGREPTLQEVSDWTGDTPERVQFLDDVARTTASLDAPLGHDSGATLGDLVPDERSESAEEIVERRMLGAAILEALDDLSEREREIIRLRYGLDDGRTRTLEDVGRDV
jgi:RNA polymerase primary sigma factor